MVEEGRKVRRARELGHIDSQDDREVRGEVGVEEGLKGGNQVMRRGVGAHGEVYVPTEVGDILEDLR